MKRLLLLFFSLSALLVAINPSYSQDTAQTKNNHRTSQATSQEPKRQNPKGDIMSKIAPPVSKEELISTFQEVSAQVEKLRKLKFYQPVKYDFKSKEEITSYIMSKMAEEYTEAELKGEERALKFFGLVAPDFELKKTYIALLTEQVAGFYDPPSNTFYIANWIGAAIQKPIMAHELTHALQDQHFQLEKKMKRVKGNDDRNLSFMALIEGEATAIMLDYSLGAMYTSFEILPDIVEIMRSQMETVNNQFQEYGRAPAILKEGLLFPYVYGTGFLQKIRQAHPWNYMATIYKNPPQSTEQIIHPEKYLTEPDPPRNIPEARLKTLVPDGFRPVFTNVFGELGMKIFFEHHLGAETALMIAEGWDGDRYLLVENVSDSKSEAMLTASSWDTLKDCLEFSGGIRKLFSLRHSLHKTINDEPDFLLLQYGQRFAGFRKQGTNCLVFENIPETMVKTIRASALDIFTEENR